MRRLTLILSDLYLPEEAGRDIASAHTLALPNLDWLLRFSRVSRIGDWRGALAADLGRADLAALPVAALAARGILDATRAASAWLASPVRLEARLDHVRLREQGLPRLTPAERKQWRAEFARAFAPFELHDAGPRGFLLTGLAPVAATSVDPARVLDADIAGALPSSASARELRRLAAEIEMWMHSAAHNLNAAGQPHLSSLWLWGGALPAIPPGPGLSATANSAVAVTPDLHGDDPGFAGLSRALTGAPPAAVPADFAALSSAQERVCVELAPMTGPAEQRLAALETNWFGPARAALREGRLPALDLIANDRWFRIAAKPGWRLWRRRRSWLDQLGQSLPQSKA